MMENYNLHKFFEYDFTVELFNGSRKTEITDKITSVPKEYYVESQGRQLYHIAYDIYGNIDLWIALALYNDIIDPFQVPNKVWFIPKEALYKILGDE